MPTSVTSANNMDANCDSAFCGAFLGPSNSLKEGNVVFLTGSSLGAGIGPFVSGDMFSLGTISYTPNDGATEVVFSFDPGTLYKISDGASQAIQDDSQVEEGPLLTVPVGVVPEPATLVLLGLSISALALRRKV